MNTLKAKLNSKIHRVSVNKVTLNLLTLKVDDPELAKEIFESYQRQAI